MKLFTKYNRINLLITVAIFLLSVIAFFFLLRYVIIGQIDQDLEIEQNEIQSAVKTYHHLPAVIPVRDQQIKYTPVNSPTLAKAELKTLKDYNRHDQDDIFVRQIAFNIDINNQWYMVTVSKSLEGTDELIQSIILITICTILLILAATLLINRVVLKKLWQPFYDTLNKAGRFKLGKKQGLDFSGNNIEEFELMNKTLLQLISKAEQDYIVLREFTENASHELQTPLAVIRSKLDILIQDENLSEKQSYAVQGAYDAIQRLTRINQSLLLLAKIENKQFTEISVVDVKDIVESKLQQFHELWLNKDIRVSCGLNHAPININLALADILFNNLFSNATKHNIAGGIITAQLSPGRFVIKNTGSAEPLDGSRIFSRFYKPGSSSEHHGLGLSLIKQISEASACSVEYTFEEDSIHVFMLRW